MIAAIYAARDGSEDRPPMRPRKGGRLRRSMYAHDGISGAAFRPEPPSGRADLLPRQAGARCPILLPGHARRWAESVS